MRIRYIAEGRLPTERAHMTQIVKMCEAFANLGKDVSLIVPTRRPGFDEDVFSYYRVKTNFSIQKIWCPDLLGKTLRLSKPLYWIDYFFFLFGLLFTNKIKKGDMVYARDPLILSIFSKKRHTLYLELHTLSKKRFFITLVNRAHKIVVLNELMKAELVKRGVDESRIQSAPDAVDTGEFASTISMEDARTKVGLPSDKKIVLYTGHLYDWKGADVLAEASKLLPNILFVFVGGVDEELAAFKTKYANISNIILTGFKPRNLMPIYLTAAHIFVLPNSGKFKISSHYTSPLKLFEYMAAKRPIVASDLPSLREVLTDENCYFAEPDNAKSLAAAIKLALENVELTEKKANKAFADVQKYTWYNRGKTILEFIKQ